VTSAEFVAGPVHVDGHQLYFFADAGAGCPLDVLATSYTALVMRETAAELEFNAYASRHTRMTEDEWYQVAQKHFEATREALRASPAVTLNVRRAVELRYFNGKVPPGVSPVLNRATAMALQLRGDRHAA
jgi:hypothetical protein